MGRKVNEEKLDVCDYLKEKGYKFACMLRKNTTEVWATKANKLKSGTFSDKSRWDCFILDLTEHYDKPLSEIVEL